MLQSEHAADVEKLKGLHGGLEEQMAQLRKQHEASMQELKSRCDAERQVAVESAEKAGAARVAQEQKEAAAQREQLKEGHSKELGARDAQHLKEQVALRVQKYLRTSANVQILTQLCCRRPRSRALRERCSRRRSALLQRWRVRSRA